MKSVILVPPPLNNAFGRCEFPHCGRGTDQPRRRFRLKQQGVEHGWTSEIGACEQARNTQTGCPKKDRQRQGPQAALGAAEICSQEDIAKALVAARDPGERCARSATRRLQADKPKEDRGFAQALGGTQVASQGGRLSLRALDADILYQPCRQDLAENPTRPPTARQDRTETPVSSRLTPSFRGASETSEPGIRRLQREIPGSRWRAPRNDEDSSRADIGHAAVEFLAQPCAFARQGARRIQYVLRRGPGFGGAAIDLRDIGGGLMGALGDALNAAGDFLGCRALLLNCARDRRGDA